MQQREPRTLSQNVLLAKSIRFPRISYHLQCELSATTKSKMENNCNAAKIPFSVFASTTTTTTTKQSTQCENFFGKIVLPKVYLFAICFVRFVAQHTFKCIHMWEFSLISPKYSHFFVLSLIRQCESFFPFFVCFFFVAALFSKHSACICLNSCIDFTAEKWLQTK